jgi:tRNA-splicing ligase RtcB
MQILEGAQIPIKVWVDDLEDVEVEARQQLVATANLPWVKGMAVMPDVHFGKGATVGSVILSEGAVSPSVVGVDIGCGMCAVKTKYTAHHLHQLPVLRHSIERSIPVGFNSHKEPLLEAVFLHAAKHIGSDAFKSNVDRGKAAIQMGTLGGGNHFVEICLDEKGDVWVMLHSGSRNLGKEVAEHHITTAKGLMKDSIEANHWDPDLAALTQGTLEFAAYITDLQLCQVYARHNREAMLRLVLKDLSYHMGNGGQLDITDGDVINCHHNYLEWWVDSSGKQLMLTRKGAVSAADGQLGIIPGSMGTKSYIVRGKGNLDAYCSCSHGAGRRMSRGKAKRSFTNEDLARQTQGVECRKDDGVLDEIPGAYKDIDVVMSQQGDLVDVVHTLKQVLCVKG